MQKDFDKWNKLKIKLNETRSISLVHEREVWWCSIGVNIGSEQDGKNNSFERPVLIVKRFNYDMVWVVPMTSVNKHNLFYFQIEKDGKVHSFILSQLKLVSTKRLRRCIYRMSTYEFAMVKGAIIYLLHYV